VVFYEPTATSSPFTLFPHLLAHVLVLKYAVHLLARHREEFVLLLWSELATLEIGLQRGDVGTLTTEIAEPPAEHGPPFVGRLESKVARRFLVECSEQTSFDGFAKGSCLGRQ